MNQKIKIPHIVYGAIALISISFLSHFYSWVNIAGLSFFVLLCLVLGLWKREYALYLAFLELTLGSFGYLLYLPIGGLNLSLRMAFFVIIMGLWAADLLRSVIPATCPAKLQRSGKAGIQISRINCGMDAYLGVLLLICAGGILQGYLRGNGLSNIFFDANSYIYLLLLLPAVSYIDTKEKFLNAVKVILVGASVLAVFTFLLFVIFIKDQNRYFLGNLYKWIRDFRIGEITSLKNGTYRIFLQSQIYLIFGFLLLAVLRIYKRIKPHLFLILESLFSAAIYISLSRSLWVGFGAGTGFLLLLLIKKFPPKKLMQNFLEIAAIVFIGVSIVTLFIPKNTSLLTNRSKVGASALSTRFEQLKPLLPAIKNSPLIGYGFGKTLTFVSFDPRVSSVLKTGEYTTYAFEWGYLDIVLKLGLVGLIAYLFFVWNIIKKLPRDNPYGIWLLSSIVALLAVHIFTPYLNHPLGIGILIFGGVAANVDKS